MLIFKRVENEKINEINKLFSEDLSSEKMIIFAGFDGDYVIGFLSVKNEEDNFILDKLKILPEYSGQKIDDALVKTALNYLEQRNVPKVYAVANDLTDFFKGLDFKECDRNECILKLDGDSNLHLLKADLTNYFKNVCCHKG